MNMKDQYEELTRKLKEIVPFTAFPSRELVQELRKKDQSITLKTELKIIKVFNSGDMSGIICATEPRGDDALVCGLTHLIVSNKHPLFREILDYQKKRIKHLQKSNPRGWG